MIASLLLKGFLLGWSVAWPPGPINAEMIRRGLARGFLPAWVVGLGACSGDFLWALAVALGAGALMTVPGVRPVLGVVSVALLLFLAWTFGRGAWRARLLNQAHPDEVLFVPTPRRFDSTRGGYLLGFSVALTSPWNLTFWLAVIGAQAGQQMDIGASLCVAAGVILGAALWGGVLCGAVQWGARFASPSWQVITQGATSVLMLVFAARAILRLAAGA